MTAQLQRGAVFYLILFLPLFSLPSHRVARGSWVLTRLLSLWADPDAADNDADKDNDDNDDEDDAAARIKHPLGATAN